MWSELEDIIEIVASVLVVVAALWAVTAKLWRAPQVINRIVESNLLDRLESLLRQNEMASKDEKQLSRKRAG